MDEAAKNQTFLMAVLDTTSPADTQVRLRGEPDDRGDTVPRGFLTVASGFSPPKVEGPQSGRLELARWIADRKNPLTARVAVNRFWQHLFGKGIVSDVNNFGVNGELPSHPELLDYLASDFMDNGWSLKQFVRSVVLTRAYQMTCASDEQGLAADPDNNLLWRQNQRRLEAEALRDAMLVASGEIDLTPGVGSIVAQVGDGDIGRNLRGSQFATNDTKRSVYLPIVRNELPEALQVFDFPEPSIIAGQRDVTTVPTQALYMMNSPFVLDRSKALAQRVLQDESLDKRRRSHFAGLPPCPLPGTSGRRTRLRGTVHQRSHSLERKPRHGRPPQSLDGFHARVVRILRISLFAVTPISHADTSGVGTDDRVVGLGLSHIPIPILKDPRHAVFPTRRAESDFLRFWIHGLRGTGGGGGEHNARLSKPAFPQAAAFRRQGQAGDLPLHAGRPIPRRYLRLQTRPDRIRRQIPRRE